jgi:hypothetical protein
LERTYGRRRQHQRRFLELTKAEQDGNRASPSNQGAGLRILGNDLSVRTLRRMNPRNPAKRNTISLKELLSLRQG